MKIKKTVSALLAISVAASMISGCGKVTGDKDKNPQITWYMMKPIENMKSQPFVEDEVNKKLQDKVGAKLKFNLVDSGSWEEKMNLIISSGEKYDINMVFATGTTSIMTNARRNAYRDIGELVDKYGSAIKKKLDPRAWDACKVDGKTLLVPSQGKYVSDISYVFKKDLVEKYGFDYKSVKNLDDLEPYLETIKQNEPNITPLYITAGADMPSPIYEDYTGTVVSSVWFDEKADKFVDELDVMYDVYKTRYKYYNKGYISKDAFTKQDSAEGKTGKYAVLRSTGAYTEDGSKSSAFYGFPCVEVLVGKSLIGTDSFLNGNAISITSENPEKAVQVLNAVWEDPYISNTIAYGIEGVDYTIVKDGNDEKKSVLPNSGTNQKWCMWHNWVGPLFDQWDSTWNSREALKQMENDNKNGKLSKSFGFIMDVSKFDTEIAAISEADDAAKTVLRIGNMDDFDSYMEKLRKKREKAGINTLLDDINKQYTEWKKKQ